MQQCLHSPREGKKLSNRMRTGSTEFPPHGNTPVPTFVLHVDARAALRVLIDFHSQSVFDKIIRFPGNDAAANICYRLRGQTY